MRIGLYAAQITKIKLVRKGAACWLLFFCDEVTERLSDEETK